MALLVGIVTISILLKEYLHFLQSATWLGYRIALIYKNKGGAKNIMTQNSVISNT